MNETSKNVITKFCNQMQQQHSSSSSYDKLFAHRITLYWSNSTYFRASSFFWFILITMILFFFFARVTAQQIQTSCITSYIHPVWHHRFACVDIQLNLENWCSKRIYSDPLISLLVTFGIGSKFFESTMRYRISQCRYMLSIVI